MIMKFLKMIYNDNDIFMMKYCYGSAIAYDDSPIIAQFLCCVYYILSFTLFFTNIVSVIIPQNADVNGKIY